MADDIPPKSAPKRGHSLLVFALKAMIVAVVVTISLLILMDNLISDLGDLIDERIQRIALQLHETGKFGGRNFWEHLEQELDRAADPHNDLPPDRQQKLLRDVRILADRARPFILEAERAFAPQSTSQAHEK
jgi:hypothetical protein